MRLRVATFNVENLLARFDFNADADRDREDPEILFYDLLGKADYPMLKAALTLAKVDDVRQLSAQAIRAVDADILCLQEVDSLAVLNAFNDRYLAHTLRRPLEHVYLVEGNDRRGIDVAVMSRPQVPVSVRSHRRLKIGELKGLRDLERQYPETVRNWTAGEAARERSVFQRDCLEVRVELPGLQLTIFNCHFKSMAGGRERTRGLRLLEAQGVRQIIEERFPDPARANWLICGDLNDFGEQIECEELPESEAAQPAPDPSESRIVGRHRFRLRSPGGPNGLAPLLEHGFAVNLLSRQADFLQRWSHHHVDDGTFAQLDYILASPGLAERNPAIVPKLVRGGLPHRVPALAGERFPRVGWDRPKASDHCPMVVEIEV